jgi:hypothetical protein
MPTAAGTEPVRIQTGMRGGLRADRAAHSIGTHSGFGTKGIVASSIAYFRL